MKHKVEHSFRTKILRATMMALISGLTASSLLMVVMHTRGGSERLDEELRAFAEILGNRSAAALVFGDESAARENLAAADFKREIQSVCLYSGNGELFASYERGNSSALCPGHSVLELREDGATHELAAVQYTDTVRLGGEALGRIHLLATTGFLWADALSFIGLAGLIAAGVLLPIILVTGRALGRAIEPLEELTTVAQESTDNVLSPVRARTILTGDEVGQLVSSFNNMLDAVSDQHRALIGSEARFKALAESAPVGVFQLDQYGTVVFGNDEWREIVGQPPGPVSLDTLSLSVKEESRELYADYWSKLKAHQHPQVIEYRYTRPADNAELFLMEHTAPMDDGTDGGAGYVGTLIDVSELKSAQLELEKLAFYDALTDLPNRRFFRDHVSYTVTRAAKQGGLVAVLMIDLDNFKNVNDLLGHDAGDLLLQTISTRIKDVLFDQDLVSRLGGDEFLVLLVGVERSGRTAEITQRILAAINEPVVIEGHTFEITASIGVSVFPDDARDVDHLLKNADTAMYSAKAEGKNTTRYYSAKLDAELRERLQLERLLKNAVADDAFDIHLQPQYSVRKGAIIGAEALLRWTDPEHGPITPDRFIPVAEETGMIIELGNFVLERVCGYIAGHYEQLLAHGIGRIAINLSARQLYSARFIDDTCAIIANAGILPECLEFEITESIVMDDTERAIEILRRLRDLGASIAMDDFGTGYSSLAYLKRFPLNTLKIDRTFIRDLPDDQNDVEIATAIIAMGQKLGLEITAEGVETERQRQFLIDQNCDYLQGYFIGRPRAVSEYIGARTRSESAKSTS